VPAGKLRRMRATEQRRVGVHMSDVRNAMGRASDRASRTAGTAGRCGLAIRPFNDFEYAAIDRGSAERARDGSAALLGMVSVPALPM
jgi:hypothetical protein